MIPPNYHCAVTYPCQEISLLSAVYYQYLVQYLFGADPRAACQPTALPPIVVYNMYSGVVYIMYCCVRVVVLQL